jgi:hypothetical protein
MKSTCFVFMLKRKKQVQCTCTRPYWRSGISSTRERNSASFHSFRYAPLVKRRNFSHSWKKSQFFNRDSCKNLLVFNIHFYLMKMNDTQFQFKTWKCIRHKLLTMLDQDQEKFFGLSNWRRKCLPIRNTYVHSRFLLVSFALVNL